MEVVRKPKELTAKDKLRANVAKNCLIVTLMSLDLGYGSILERYQRECNSTPPELNSVTLTEEELLTHMNVVTFLYGLVMAIWHASLWISIVLRECSVACDSGPVWFVSHSCQSSRTNHPKTTALTGDAGETLCCSCVILAITRGERKVLVT